MRFVKLIFSLFLISLIAFTACGKKKSDTAIRLATDATWPPMEMVAENKKIVGYSIDYFTAVAEEAGFEVKFINTAWDGIFAGIAAGKYEAVVSSVTITKERKKAMDFSDPYFEAGQVLVVSKDMKNISALKDMKGKKVGAQIGTTGAFEIKKVKGVTLKTYDEVGLAFEDLAAGRLGGVVCDSVVAINYALKKKEYKDKFIIAGKPFTNEFYGAAVKKGDTKTLELLNKGIKAVKAKKIDLKLNKKWLQ